MAILAVKIDTLATLRMNEFFDYSGRCWAVSRSRESEEAVGLELENFYEGTVQSGCIEKVPVVFIYKDTIVGWYEEADVYRYMRHPALFLEGNIEADVHKAHLLKKAAPLSDMEITFDEDRNYLVIESGDERYDRLKKWIYETNPSLFEVIDYAHVPVDPRLKDQNVIMRGKGGPVSNTSKALVLLMQCQALAKEIMEDRCHGIDTVKGLFETAEEVTRYDRHNANGWYYLAMANYQLGFVKKGLKAIDRALSLEPEEDDLLVMKANLLVSHGYLEEALKCYEEAHQIQPDDTYYIMAGRACACMGSEIAANQYYRKVKDKKLLKEFEVTLSRRKFI